MKACRAALLGVALAAALGACTGSFFKSSAPPTSTYLLSVKPEATAGAVAVPADLTVLMPRVRTGLDNDRIAALYPDRRLDYFAAARWSAAVRMAVRDWLGVSASISSRQCRIAGFPEASARSKAGRKSSVFSTRSP